MGNLYARYLSLVLMLIFGSGMNNRVLEGGNELFIMVARDRGDLCGGTSREGTGPSIR